MNPYDMYLTGAVVAALFFMVVLGGVTYFNRDH